MKHVLSLILFTLSFLGSQAQEMKVYSDEANEISIKYPSSWEYQANPATIFILIRPVEEQGQIFRENINLIIDDDQNLNLQEYVGAGKIKMRNMLSGYVELSTKYFELGGRKYARIIFQHNTQDLPLQVAYYLTLHKGKSYNLTCSSTHQNFETYLPIFQKNDQ